MRVHHRPSQSYSGIPRPQGQKYPTGSGGEAYTSNGRGRRDMPVVTQCDTCSDNLTRVTSFFSINSKGKHPPVDEGVCNQ
eukprot:1393998-Amorphochlora_amoeboformis.AAC.1